MRSRIAVCISASCISADTPRVLQIMHPLITSVSFIAGFGVISAPVVEAGFRLVDRKIFVPKVTIMTNMVRKPTQTQRNHNSHSRFLHVPLLRTSNFLRMLISP